MWSGVQSEQHLPPGLREEPECQLKAQRSHDAPGAIPLFSLSMVPLPSCQLRYVSSGSIHTGETAGSKLYSDWQITPPQPANPLTPPTPVASRPRHPHTTTEPRPSPALALSAHRTAGTAG